MQTSSWSLYDPPPCPCPCPCPLPRVLIRVYSSWLVACIPGSWLAPPLVLPNHSTALTTADRGCMDFPSVAVPWSPCSSLFAWPDLQPLAGLPAQHPGAESPLEHHLAQFSFQQYLPSFAWIRGISQIPDVAELRQVFLLSTSCSASIRGICRIPRCS